MAEGASEPEEEGDGVMPAGKQADTPDASAGAPLGNSPNGMFVPIGLSLENVQKSYVLKTLDHCSQNKTLAANMLGVSRKALYDKLQRWGVSN